MPGGPADVEVIVNGEVVAKGKDINKPIRLKESCWIAARCGGAHTSPIYVTLEGRRRGSAKEAREFLGVIDRLTEWVNTKGLFDSAKEKEAVLDVIRQGRSVYESIVKQETK
jgi:LmbE family N-acetylglucosaminyl deacetylase